MYLLACLGNAITYQLPKYHNSIKYRLANIFILDVFPLHPVRPYHIKTKSESFKIEK